MPAQIPADRDHYRTPRAVWERVRQLGEVGLDPCAHPSGPGRVEAREQWAAHGGRWCGLFRSWSGNGLVYAFPPPSRINDWAAKIAAEGADTEIIALFSAWPEQPWWHDHIYPTASAICWWRGLVGLGGAKRPEPIAVAYWGGRIEQFAAAFETAGAITLNRDVWRPAKWVISVPRIMPLASKAPKHERVRNRLIRTFAEEIRLANALVGCPAAHGRRRLVVTRYGALLTNQASVDTGGELVVRALRATGLVSTEHGYAAEHRQDLDRTHPRTEIEITEESR